jgi:N-acetylmuramoyl-L-alanine amidase
MNRYQRFGLFIFAIVLILFLFLPLHAESPKINVIYPKMNALIPSVDSTFIFGSVTPDAELSINGVVIPVHKEGGFIAFLPVHTGDFTFRLIGRKDGDSVEVDWPVRIAEDPAKIRNDSLYLIKSDSLKGNCSYANGEILVVEFRGTPGCIAYFSIPGFLDSIPMAETFSESQAYWGETTFGKNDSLLNKNIRGLYRGFYLIDNARLADSSLIIYHLTVPDSVTIAEKIKEDTSKLSDQNIDFLTNFSGRQIIDSSDYYIKINSDDYPRMVEFIDSMQIIRVGPKRGYLTIFQPAGIMAMAVGYEGDWVKLQLSETQYGWVQRKSIRFLKNGYTPMKSYIKTIRVDEISEGLLIEIPLAAKHPYRIEETGQKSAAIQIFGANSDTDWIRYNLGSRTQSFITWSQPEPDLYQVNLNLDFPIWGYDTYYEDNSLKCKIIKPPENINKIKGKTIVIDPGHSADPGAIGPTGLKESEANLSIALALKEELTKKGAKVVMTRDDMSDLPLYDRPAIAKLNMADIFISTHNNALPDGVNPFVNNGISTYYYHLHSIALAREVQSELLDITQFGNFGLYYGNFAVNRPTQYPAILIECAFIILPEHEAMLRTKEFQKKLAKGITRGVGLFLKNYGK